MLTINLHSAAGSPKDILTIAFSAIPEGTVHILSSTGAVVKSFNTSDKEYELSVSDLAPGVYLVNYNNGLRRISGRFVKQ